MAANSGFTRRGSGCCPALGILMLGGPLLAGCAPSQVRVDRESAPVGLARPSAVYVYTFAVDPSDVQLDRGGPLARLRDTLSGGSDPQQQDAQAGALGKQVADSFTGELVKRIVAMGFTAQRLACGQGPPLGSMAVDGLFVNVDEGNKVRRMAIGFHQGQSQVGAQVHLFAVTATGNQPLLDFTATSASPPMPGAAVTMGAGAAAQAAAAASGVKEMRDTVQADASRLADQVANNLQQYFAKQGWTAPPSALPTL